MKEDILKYKNARQVHSNVLRVLYNYYDANQSFFNNELRDFFNNRSKKSVKSISISGIKLEGNDLFNYISMFIYPDSSIQKSVSEIVKDKNLLKGTDNLEMLDAILHANFGIYKPLSYNFLNKTIIFVNVITNEKIEVIDETLSNSLHNLNNLNFYLVARVIKYKTISFLTNAIVLNKDKENNEYIKKIKLYNLTNIDIYLYALAYKNRFKNSNI